MEEPRNSTWVNNPREPSFEQPSPEARHVSQEAILEVNPSGWALPILPAEAADVLELLYVCAFLCPYHVYDPQNSQT